MIQLVSVYAGSQRLRGACLRAATTAGRVVVLGDAYAAALRLRVPVHVEHVEQSAPGGGLRAGHLREVELEEVAVHVHRPHPGSGPCPASRSSPGRRSARSDSRPWRRRRSRCCAGRSRRRSGSGPPGCSTLPSPRSRACVCCQRSGSLSRLRIDGRGRVDRTRPGYVCVEEIDVFVLVDERVSGVRRHRERGVLARRTLVEADG